MTPREAIEAWKRARGRLNDLQPGESAIEIMQEAEKALYVSVAGVDEQQLEIERCHDALDQIYDYLVVLEGSLAREQLLLCPIEYAKWRKHPEWEERYAHGQTEEGRQQRKLQLEARTKQLRDQYYSVNQDE